MATLADSMMSCRNIYGGARLKRGAGESTTIIEALTKALAECGKQIEPSDNTATTAHKLYVALKSFDVTQKDYAKICEGVRQAINTLMGEEVIKLSSRPAELISNIDEHLRALQSRHCGEFDVIKANAKQSIKNLQTLLEMIRNAYDSIIASAPKDMRPNMEATKSVIDYIRDEAQRQIRILGEFLEIPVQNVEATIANMRSDISPKFIKKVSDSSMSDRLASILMGLGETGLLKTRVESALAALGLKMGENSKTLSEAFFDKMKALEQSDELTEDSMHMLLESYNTISPLTDDTTVRAYPDNFVLVTKSRKKLGGAAGAAVAGGGKLRAIGDTLRRKIAGYKIAMQAFRGAMNVYYDKLTFTIDHLATYMSHHTDKLTDDHEKFKIAIDKLDHLQSPIVFRALSGLHDDADSIATRDRIIDYMRIVAERAIILKPDNELYGDVGAIIYDMISRIGQYSALKPFSGGAESAGDATIIESAGSAQKVAFGGKELFMTEPPHDDVRAWKLSDAVQRYIYYANMQKVNKSMDFAETDVAQYTEDYPNIVGAAVGQVLNDAKKELRRTLKQVDRIFHKEYDGVSRKIRLPDAADRTPVNESLSQPLNECAVNDTANQAKCTELKDAVLKYYKQKYRKLEKTYKFAQLIDIYLMKFTDSAIKNRQLLVNVFTNLEATEYIATWMSENSGDRLVDVMENFPPCVQLTLQDRTPLYTMPTVPADNESAHTDLHAREMRAPAQGPSVEITGQMYHPGRYRSDDAVKFPAIKEHYYKTLFDDYIRSKIQPEHKRRALGDCRRAIEYKDHPEVMEAIRAAKRKSKSNKNLINLFFKIGQSVAGDATDDAFSPENAQHLLKLGGFDDDGDMDMDSDAAVYGGGNSTDEDLSELLERINRGVCIPDVHDLLRNNTVKYTRYYEHRLDPPEPKDHELKHSARKNERRYMRLSEMDTMALDLKTYTLNAIAGKIFAAIGLYNRTHNHLKTHGSADIITQTVFGRGLAVEVIPGAAELYMRLPLLVEFYRDVLGFEEHAEYTETVSKMRSGYRNGANIGDPLEPADDVDGHRVYNSEHLEEVRLVGSKITMVPDVDGMYATIIRIIFDSNMYKTGSDNRYSESIIKDMVSAINQIYSKCLATSPTDPTGEAFRGLVREINRRIMIVKWADAEKYIKQKQAYKESKLVNTMNTTGPYGEFGQSLPKLDKKHTMVPSDKYVKFSLDAPKPTLSIVEKMNIFKAFRTRILRKFAGADPSKYNEFGAITTEFKTKLKLAADNSAGFAEVVNMFGGLDRGPPVDVVKYMMFHECVAAPLETLRYVYAQCCHFIAAVNRLDISQTVDGNVYSAEKWAAYIATYTSTPFGNQNGDGGGGGAAAPPTMQAILYDLINAIYQFAGDSNGMMAISVDKANDASGEFAVLSIDHGKLQSGVTDLLRSIDTVIAAFVEQLPHALITRYIGSTVDAGSLAYMRKYLLDIILRDDFVKPTDLIAGANKSIIDCIGTINRILKIYATVKFPTGVAGAALEIVNVCSTFRKLIYAQDAGLFKYSGAAGTMFNYARTDPTGMVPMLDTADNTNNLPGLYSLPVYPDTAAGYIAYIPTAGYPTHYYGNMSGVIHTCNQILTYILNISGDGKPYMPVISALADNSVYAKKAYPNTYVHDREYYGDPAEIVYLSNAARIHRYMESQNGKYIFAEADLSKVGTYVKDILATALPLIWRMSLELQKKCEFIRDLLRYGNFNTKLDVQLDAYTSGANAPVTSVLAKYCSPRTSAIVRNTEFAGHMLEQLANTGDVLYRVINMCQENLTTLSDNMLFGEHKVGFINNYRSSAKRIPILPISLVVVALRVRMAARDPPYLLPNEAPTTAEFKYNRAVRSAISPGITMTIDRCPYNLALFADYDVAVDRVNKIDKAVYSDHMLNHIALAQYAMFQKVYRSVCNNTLVQYLHSSSLAPAGLRRPYPDVADLHAALVLPAAPAMVVRSSSYVHDCLQSYMGVIASDPDGAGAVGVADVDKTSAIYKMYGDGSNAARPDDYPVGPDPFGYTDDPNQTKCLHYMTKYLCAKPVRISRPDMRVYNILDMGVVPINLNVLRREIPFVNITNYHLGFVDMVHDFMELGQSQQPLNPPVPAKWQPGQDRKSPHRLLYKLIQDPFMPMSYDEYTELGKFVRGCTDLPRPLYLSDQMWNKCLLSNIHIYSDPVTRPGDNNTILLEVEKQTPPHDTSTALINTIYMSYFKPHETTGATITKMLAMPEPTPVQTLGDGVNVPHVYIVAPDQHERMRQACEELAKAGQRRFDMLFMRRIFHKTLLHYIIMQKLAREIFANSAPITRGLSTVGPAQLGYNPYNQWADNVPGSDKPRARRQAYDTGHKRYEMDGNNMH